MQSTKIERHLTDTAHYFYIKLILRLNLKTSHLKYNHSVISSDFSDLSQLFVFGCP